MQVACHQRMVKTLIKTHPALVERRHRIVPQVAERALEFRPICSSAQSKTCVICPLRSARQQRRPIVLCCFERCLGMPDCAARGVGKACNNILDGERLQDKRL